MTNEDLLTDLKQFITATISQQTAELATKDDLRGLKDDLQSVEQRLASRFDGLDQKLDQVQASVADALDTANNEQDVLLKDHEQRLSRLEHRTA